MDGFSSMESSDITACMGFGVLNFIDRRKHSIPLKRLSVYCTPFCIIQLYMNREFLILLGIIIIDFENTTVGLGTK